MNLTFPLCSNRISPCIVKCLNMLPKASSEHLSKKVQLPRQAFHSEWGGNPHRADFQKILLVFWPKQSLWVAPMFSLLPEVLLLGRMPPTAGIHLQSNLSRQLYVQRVIHNYLPRASVYAELLFILRSTWHAHSPPSVVSQHPMMHNPMNFL